MNLGCSLNDCRMRGEADVVVPGEENHLPVHLVSFLADQAI
jgi:hypothetical protein